MYGWRHSLISSFYRYLKQRLELIKGMRYTNFNQNNKVKLESIDRMRRGT